jgi:hypothetical protein
MCVCVWVGGRQCVLGYKLGYMGLSGDRELAELLNVFFIIFYLFLHAQCGRHTMAPRRV